MDPMPIVIYSRAAGESKVRRYCKAILLSENYGTIVFETETFIPPQLGVTYHVAVGSRPQVGSPSQFRELEIYPNEGREKTLTYIVKTGPEWTGFLEEEDSESSEEEKA